MHDHAVYWPSRAVRCCKVLLTAHAIALHLETGSAAHYSLRKAHMATLHPTSRSKRAACPKGPLSGLALAAPTTLRPGTRGAARFTAVGPQCPDIPCVRWLARLTYSRQRLHKVHRQRLGTQPRCLFPAGTSDGRHPALRGARRHSLAMLHTSHVPVLKWAQHVNSGTLDGQP